MGEIIVSIDIGTSKVCTLIGKMNKANQLEVIGKGIVSFSGVKKGTIVDIDSTSKAIRESVEQAELMANINVGSAYVNIIGMHVNVINNKSCISISHEDREITKKDVEKILYAVKDVQVPEDRQIIDIIPRQYTIDGYDEIIDPVGMVGVTLEVEADIVIGKITSVQNIVKSMERANLRVDGLVIEAYASGEIVLTPDEKDVGVILIDIGGGVTDISVFQNKHLVFYNSMPVGGDHITNDIAIGLKISYAEAEKIKRQYELALTSLIKNDQEISVCDINEDRKKNVKISEVIEIIEARVYEIFSLSKGLLQRSNVSMNTDAGIVLAGGGISYVDGNKQLANEVFELPVRVVSCKTTENYRPEFLTAAGMIKYVSNIRKGNNSGSKVSILKQKNVQKESGFFNKISKLLSRLF